MNQVSIGSDNGLAPIRCQAIIYTNAGLLSIGPLGTNFSEILIKIHFFIYENASENNVCEMAAILSRGRCVNFPCGWTTIATVMWFTRSDQRRYFESVYYFTWHSMSSRLKSRPNQVLWYWMKILTLFSVFMYYSTWLEPPCSIAWAMIIITLIFTGPWEGLFLFFLFF